MKRNQTIKHSVFILGHAYIAYTVYVNLFLTDKTILLADTIIIFMINQKTPTDSTEVDYNSISSTCNGFSLITIISNKRKLF